MSELLFLTAFLFLLACAAWLVSIVVLAVVRAQRLWQYGVRHLLVFTTVAALTAAMSATLLDYK